MTEPAGEGAAEPSSSAVPDLRLRLLIDRPTRPDGDYVVYWMIAQRRASWNFALDRALELAAEFNKPLVVFEPLRCGYRWASDRIHRFVIDGMADNARAFDDTAVTYFPWLERQAGEGSGLLEALAEHSCAIVTDDFPSFFLPRMVEAASQRLDVRMESVDGNGLLPLRAADKVYKRAVDMRRFLQKTLAPWLDDLPAAKPLEGLELPTLDKLPTAVTGRWPSWRQQLLGDGIADLDQFAIDHQVPPGDAKGGSEAGVATLGRFLNKRLRRYNDGRRDLDQRSTSELSPYLHFGHLSAHQVLAELAGEIDWDPSQVRGESMRGARQGWWGLDEDTEGFLDQLVTWRELGYNMTWQGDDYDTYESLPEWARATIEMHLDDERPHIYSLEQLEAADTYDEIWNAAQRELVIEGRMHNYLRMLWGKKIFEWSRTPQDALDAMIELNNKYALDGRNPNSYSGIFWCLGRYDRAWGPEREIFGKIRYMSSDSTRRKLDLTEYLKRYASFD